MTGEERTRHCQACDLNVYNISALSVGEVERLVSTREGRTCIRMYRRADGTVLTRDCPVGLRSYQKRVARFAGATLGAILGLFSVSFGQKEDSKAVVAQRSAPVTAATPNIRTGIEGTVVDDHGAVVPGIRVFLYKKGAKVATKTVSDDEGRFNFSGISEGQYHLKVPAESGFKKLVVENIIVEKEKMTVVKLNVVVTGETTIGVVAIADPIDITLRDSSPMLTTREMHDRPRTN